jgi:imidazolonepropionase-like amidohydrolase
MSTILRHLRTAAFFLCSSTLALPCDSAFANDVRIEHVTIVSAERAAPLKNATVSIRDDKITRISRGNSAGALRGSHPGPQIIDGHGLYLVPGLIDSHVHLSSLAGMTAEQENLHPDIARAARRQMPRSFLLFGFTTLVDLISTPAIMSRWNSQEIAPDTYFCGGAALKDAYPMVYVPKPARYDMWPYMIVESGDASSLPAGIEAAAHTPEAAVARMKADGAICVKTFFERGFGDQRNLPVPRLETIRALVSAAHAAGLPVLLHANAQEAQQFGVDSGVDIIAHGLWNWHEASSTTELTPAVKAILDRVVSQKVGWQPTIQVVAGLQNMFNPSFLSEPMLTRALPRSLIDWYGTKEGQWFHDELASEVPRAPHAGGPADAQLYAGYALLVNRVERATGYLAMNHARLLFGTDTPSAPTYTNPPGLNGWFEMQRLIEAGVTPAQIFQAATLSNAQAFKLDNEIGTVQVGKRANLLLLHHDPTQTIEAYAGIAKIILRGHVIDPAELAASHAQRLGKTAG